MTIFRDSCFREIYIQCRSHMLMHELVHRLKLLARILHVKQVILACRQFDLDNETDTIRNYRQRVRQCEALSEFAMAEEIREILRNEQEHQIDLATALGQDVPEA